jgi:hypothetical protein
LRITEAVPRTLSIVRPKARVVIERGRWRTRRMKGGRSTLAVVERYCVFYADGCVLHMIGAAEGDKNMYKPCTCITFPLDRSCHNTWYVRQKGYKYENWDLPCLDPSASHRSPAESLAEEISFATYFDLGLEDWRK